MKVVSTTLNTAKRWRYIQDVPKARRPKVESKVPSFISATEFGMLYAACDQATLPGCINSDAGDYWRALLSWLYLTGWRISATLSWLGGVRGHRVESLGVEHFGQSGNLPDLYRHYGLDTESIVAACRRIR